MEISGSSNDGNGVRRKIADGVAGYVLEDVPHFSDYIGDLPTYPNPLRSNPAYSVVKLLFTRMDLEESTFAMLDLVKRSTLNGMKYMHVL
ncbi:hypothetical protein MLD38_015415 [Melastoma candidum]|uniref:Uncharacterized protein n=1 Tax=Melastoma candidum TaxID=119954 RepID=A0ACB9RHY9_9MYRT|nr:hypothetical protein MLD38_015415 [Melastoma candidum]